LRLLERLKAAGVTRSVFYIQAGTRDEVERSLDDLTELAAQWDG
jgi:hypothetical protein